MPELHKLTTILGVLQDRGQRVALITDGRMSGASGKIPAAIHVTPEALDNGPIARLQDGDIVFLDVHRGKLTLLEDLEKFNARTITPPDLSKMNKVLDVNSFVFSVNRLIVQTKGHLFLWHEKCKRNKVNHAQ